MHEWQFEWLTTRDAIERPDFIAWWRCLSEAAASPQPFFTPEVVGAWLKVYSGVVHWEPRFLVGHRKGGGELLLPLVSMRGEWKDAWPRVWQPVGFNDFDYHDPLVSPDLASCEEDLWDVVLAEVQRAGAGNADVLLIPRLHAPRQSAWIKPVEVSPFLDLSQFSGVEALLRILDRRMRGDVRRQERRLETVGPVRLRVAAPDALDAALGMLREFKRCHRARWPHDSKPAGFLDAILRDCLAAGHVHLSALEVGDRPISWVFGFRNRDRLYSYNIAFDAEWANYSPGKVHLLLLIKHAMETGIRVIDFLRGDEPYKWQWTSSFDQLYEIRCVLPGLRPMAAATVRSAMRMIGRPMKRVVSRLGRNLGQLIGPRSG